MQLIDAAMHSMYRYRVQKENCIVLVCSMVVV